MKILLKNVMWLHFYRNCAENGVLNIYGGIHVPILWCKKMEVFVVK